MMRCSVTISAYSRSLADSERSQWSAKSCMSCNVLFTQFGQYARVHSLMPHFSQIKQSSSSISAHLIFLHGDLPVRKMNSFAYFNTARTADYVNAENHNHQDLTPMVHMLMRCRNRPRVSEIFELEYDRTAAISG